ncbi:MAG: response regulator transcription factor [Rhodospirillales bacterium]|nr:response regulator transcription factor [Rhodospirillales bacterium]
MKQTATRNGNRILIVDDDDDFRQILSQQMQLHEGFVATQVATAADALRESRNNSYDFIILDVGLPDMDGREACRVMRRNGVTTPIIMLTGADTEVDTILGLDSGANDYVTKPFRIEVLLARIRALDH